MPYCKVAPVIDMSVKALCAKPYHGHPHGCPNFGTKRGCPPIIDNFAEIFDMPRGSWAIYNMFDLNSYVKSMRFRHPNWSERQLYNCLYWQGTARKRLKTEIRIFQSRYDYAYDLMITACPEALGVNVTRTMEDVGIKLEWPPKEFAYQVALAGYIRFPWLHDKYKEFFWHFMG